jgi:hypothetical protein
MSWKGSERSVRGAVEGLPLPLTGETEEIHENAVIITDVPAEWRSWNFPNTNEGRFRCIKLLGKFLSTLLLLKSRIYLSVGQCLRI